MNSKPSIFRSIFYRKSVDYYRVVNGWILLSKFMIDKLNIIDKPWEVIEGIYNPMDTPIQLNTGKQNSTFRIFYGGTLARRYGIMNLVNAVVNSSKKNLELVICGLGDAVDEINKLTQEDSRIKLLGSIPRSEVLKHILTADLLVNPRTNEGEFTKYSFPSKTMEYLSSGIPTLLYRLPGIPEEYYDYCFSLEENGVERLQTEIERIAEMPRSKLSELGNRAKRFILEKKNPIAQCEKFFSIMNRLE